MVLLQESIQQLECEHASVTAALKHMEDERATLADTCERLGRDLSHLKTAIKVCKVSHSHHIEILQVAVTTSYTHV